MQSPMPLRTSLRSRKFNKNNPSKLPDVSEIYLKDEETHKVPIYDTCDEV